MVGSMKYVLPKSRRHPPATTNPNMELPCVRSFCHWLINITINKAVITKPTLLDVIKASRVRDQIMGYSLHGIHKDELNMLLGDFPIKREGSQGQNKTYLVALKLAQFDFLKRTGTTVPLLLLDDIFDKLDASRVEQIIKLVAGDNFGQIFITDTNREHLDRILHKVGSDYKMFQVDQGVITEREEDEA